MESLMRRKTRMVSRLRGRIKSGSGKGDAVMTRMIPSRSRGSVRSHVTVFVSVGKFAIILMSTMVVGC